MANRNVDLTSKDWRDIVFADRNKDFGAYQLRKDSDKRHNMAAFYTLIGLVVLFLLIIGWSKYSDYRDEQERLALIEERERMQALEVDMAEEETPEEEEPEEQKMEMEIPEVPEEVLATVQVTQIAIVDAEEVKNAVMDMEDQKEDNTARGVVNQEGSDEQPAEFPGGPAAMMKWLSNNIRYPEAAQANGIHGRVVVKFVVEKDGSIGSPSIVKGVDRDLDQEALRVVKRMPKWQPGKNNGQPVRSYFNLPVPLRLQNQ